MTALVVSIIVLGTSGFFLWRAFEPRGRGGKARETPAGYYLLLPDSVDAALEDANGGATALLTSNLPEGTMALVTYTETGRGGGGMSCCPAVHGGQLSITVDNGGCQLPPGAQGSTGFELTVSVRPAFDNVTFERPAAPPGQSPASPPSQPVSVLAVLGDRFEDLTGDQVSRDGNVDQIVVTQTYDWPADSCAGNRAFMIPETCDEQHSQGPISEDHSAQFVAGSVVGMLLQSRLCELWGAATPEFQADHPWSEFRVRWDQWLQDLGPLTGPSGSDSKITAEVVHESEETFDAGSPSPNGSWPTTSTKAARSPKRSLCIRAPLSRAWSRSSGSIGSICSSPGMRPALPTR